MKSSFVPLALLGLLFTTGCQFRGIPSHGGGKRFLREQELVSESARAALGSNTWGAVTGKGVRVFVHSVSDDGGGNGDGGRLGLGGLLGVSGGGSHWGADASAGASNAFAYGTHAFASARDIEYITGLIIERVYQSGGRIVSTGESGYDGDVHVMVHVLGTDKSTDSYVIAWRDNLRGKVDLSAVYLPREGGYTQLGEGRSSHTYSEMHILGITMEDGRVYEDRN